MNGEAVIKIGQGNYVDKGCKLHPSCLDCPTHPSECPEINSNQAAPVHQVRTAAESAERARRKAERAKQTQRERFLWHMLLLLPLDEGKWTADRRQKWLTLIEAVVDMEFEVRA